MGEQARNDGEVMDQVREYLSRGHGVFFRYDPQIEFTMYVIPDCRPDEAPMVALAQAKDRNRVLAEALEKIGRYGREKPGHGYDCATFAREALAAMRRRAMDDLPFSALEALAFVLGCFLLFCMSLGLIDCFTYLTQHLIMEWKP